MVGKKVWAVCGHEGRNQGDGEKVDVEGVMGKGACFDWEKRRLVKLGKGKREEGEWDRVWKWEREYGKVEEWGEM